MNIHELVQRHIDNEISYSFCLEKIEDAIQGIRLSGSSVELQKLRVAKNFLAQYQIIFHANRTTSDFLTCLRDYILFIGKINVPNKLVEYIKNYGADYELHIEGRNTVNATYGIREEPLVSYLDKTYLKEPFKGRKSFLSHGDKFLTDATGYSQYKSFEQKIAVHTMLHMPEDHTLLFSFPTGAGKSLITQMAAFHGSGLTILIVPTIALGRDQYRAAMETIKDANSNNIISLCGGNHSSEQKQHDYTALKSGTVNLLITSPESIAKNNELQQILFDLNGQGRIDYLIIDEAHIVQDWGTSFRPDFQVMSVFRNKLINPDGMHVRTVLLSATLTENAVEKLRYLFSNDGKWITLRCDALRSEPRYYVTIEDSIDKWEEKIIRYCQLMPKPLILYEMTPDLAVAWQRKLKEAGLNHVSCYTGETNDVERELIIESWNNDTVNIMVATSAFGMGVDKPNVRTIIHPSLPANLSDFYQEVGRSGRDGLPSISITCLYKDQPVDFQKSIFQRRVLTAESMADRFFSMKKTASADRNTVELNTSTAPSSFTSIEKKNRGSRNRNWNLSLLFFLASHGLVKTDDYKFFPAEKTYLFPVQLIKTEIFSEPETFIHAVEEIRQQDYQDNENGFSLLQSMVKHSKENCFSESFISLFPNAEPVCGGCPAHKKEILTNDHVLLHNTVEPFQGYFPQNKKSIIGEIMVMAEINIKEESQFVTEVEHLIQKLKNSNIYTIVLPEELITKITNDFPGMILSIKEFDILFNHGLTSILDGVIGVFGNNRRENEKLFSIMRKINISPKVYYCSQDMSIDNSGKSIQHVFDGSVLFFSELQEERYV